MIRIAALTSGRNTPSSRFRVRQHIGALSKHDIEVTEYVAPIPKYAAPPFFPSNNPSSFFLPVKFLWALVKIASRIPSVVKSHKADLLWLERDFHPGLISLDPFLKRPFALDVDDAVWLSKPLGVQAMKFLGRRAAVIFAGNSYIADWFSPYSDRIRIIPTAVDNDKMNTRPEGAFTCGKSPFRIGWTGTSSNFVYLYGIEEPLACFLEDHDAEFWIVSDRSPVFNRLPINKVRYIRWSPDIEYQVLPRLDVGLMPLFDNAWTRGKCSFKMLQYMSAGIPVIASPVGMNLEVLSLGRFGFTAGKESDWFDTLSCMYRNRPLCAEYGARGRRICEIHFDRKKISETLAAIFKSLV